MADLQQIKKPVQFPVPATPTKQASFIHPNRPELSALNTMIYPAAAASVACWLRLSLK